MRSWTDRIWNAWLAKSLSSSKRIFARSASG